jgi:phosphatidylserine/phosphatidylglycerophosphate/cardiolipin synthase-like enzyme
MKKMKSAHSHYIIVFLFLSIALSSCAFLNNGSDAPAQEANAGVVEPASSSTPSTSPFQIYFTDPAAPHAKDYRGGPDTILAAAIDQARLTVDVAAYSLNLWSIRDALIDAHKRGLVVRMVMESDNMVSREVQQIKDSGIPVVDDQQEGLMHNKFVIIDRSEVWTGSMNFTTGGAYRDNNNLIAIRSDKVAEDFTREFEEMFIHHLFGPNASSDTPYPKLTIEGTPVEIYFSPEDKVAQRIIALIRDARESIYFMAYNFTSNDIGNAIMQKAQAGVNVSGIMDNTQISSSQGTEYDPFMQAGVDVLLDGNQDGLMHHKVMIIDQKIVITGSYNFTASAENNNDENTVIIFSPEIAMKFYQEFQRLHDQAMQSIIESTPEPTFEPGSEPTTEPGSVPTAEPASEPTFEPTSGPPPVQP